MRIQRQALAATALLAVIFAPEMASAQNNAQRVPSFLAVTFRSPGEPKLGVEVAEGIRQRMLRFFPTPPGRAMRVLTQQQINTTLMTSGFAADSVLSLADFRDLSKVISADEAMEGTVKRTAAGVEARAKFYYNSNMAAPEVLPVVTEKTGEAAGRKIAELYVQARKELPAYERCKNALIQNNPDAAIVAANEAMQLYDQGVLPRACLLTAYGSAYKKFPADSIIRLGNEIIAIDPDNAIAVAQLVEGYRAKGDTAKAIEFASRLNALMPDDTEQAKSIAEFFWSVGAPDKALAIVDYQIKLNPGDASILELQWRIFQNTNQWKRAIAAGEEMVKFDSAKADTNYFRRQIGAALKDSQPVLALQFLSRATAKFPRDAALLQAYSQELRKQGQLQQALDVAKKAVAIDPNAPLGNATVVILYAQLGQGDSAVAFARRALPTADSTTRAQIGTGLLSLIAPSMVIAQDTTAPPDVARKNWTDVYTLSATVDSIVPQMSTAFYMSFAAYNLATNALARVTDLSRARNTAGACAELKTAADMVLLVELNMPRGGRFNPQGAGAILNAVSSQLKPYIDQTRTSLRCR